MQLTAEVPAWLSSVLRIVVRYANKNVILGNTVVTKHERWGRTWPRFTALALALTPRRRKGNVEAKGWPPSTCQVTRRSLVQGLDPARLPLYGPPLQHDLTRRSMRYE